MSYSRPYDRKNSILGQVLSSMKKAVKKYTPSLVQTNWVQDLINDDIEEIGEEEDRDVSNRNNVERSERDKGIYQRNNESVRRNSINDVGIYYEGSHILENDNSVTVEFKGYEATFPRRNTLNEDEMNDEDPNTVVLTRPPLRKLKRGRTDNFKEDTNTGPLKKFANSRENQTDDASIRTDSSIGIDRPINSFQSYSAYKTTPHLGKTSSHNVTNSCSMPRLRPHKSPFDTSTINRTNRYIIPPNSAFITNNQSQQPTTRLFVSNRGRLYVSKAGVSSPCRTTPLYSKNEKGVPEPPMVSPFYNRPIVYGGIMAYQGYKPRKTHTNDSNTGSSGQSPKMATNLNSTMTRINKTINRFDNDEQTKETTYKFPPLKYNTELYTRMTAGGTSDREGPPIKNRQVLPQYSLNQQPSKNAGKMKRDKDKLHEVRGGKNEEEEEEDDDAKESMLFLSNIRLPPMQLQPLTTSSSSLLPSTSLPSSSPPPITNQSNNNTKPPPTKSLKSPNKVSNKKIAKGRFNFRTPISIPENATRANAFQWMHPRSTVKTSKQPTSQKTLLGTFTVNYDTAKKKESTASKISETSHVPQLKQASVLDALNKLPTTSTTLSSASTTQTPPSTSSTTVMASKWVCTTCMVENLGDTKSCIYCFNTKPTPASKSLFSTSKSLFSTTKSLFSTTKSPPEVRKVTKPSMLIPTTLTTTVATAASTAGGAIASIASTAKTQCTKPSLASMFGAKQGEWSCDVCMVRNSSDALKCVACETDKPGSSKCTKPSLASMFGAKQGEWSCDVCMVRNSSDALKCVACETDKPGTSKSAAAVVVSSTPATSTSNFGSNLASIPFGATASLVQLNLEGGGFKFAPGNTATTTSSTFTGGFKPTSTLASTLLSANMPTSQPPNSTSNNFGGFKFAPQHSLPTSQPPISSSNNFGGFRFAPEHSLPTSTTTAVNTFGALTATATSSTSQTPASNPATSSTFSFVSTPASSQMFTATTTAFNATSVNTGFGTVGSSATNTGLFSSFKSPTSTTASFESAPSQPLFGAGLTNASQSGFSMTTTSTTTSFFATATTTISMFGNNPTSSITTKAIGGMFGGSTVSTANSLFGNNAATTNPIFNNKTQTSSLFPPSNTQFSIFPSATTTTSTNTFVTTTTTQNSFLSSNTTSTPSNAFQLSNNNNTFTGFAKQENNNNFTFKNTNSNFPTSSTSNLFPFSTSQTTLSTSTGNSLFQFGAQPSTNTAFSSPQAFSFSMGKKTENPKKRAFNSSVDNEVDNKKTNSALLPSAGFSFGKSNNNQGSGFSSTSSSMLQPSTAFTFGQQATQQTTQPQQPTQPQQSTQPAAFSFGQQQNKPFSFGQQQPQQQTPFQFGNQQQQQPVFSFAQQQPQQQANPQQSPFTFGQQPQSTAFAQQTPQQPQQNQQQPGGFNFSSTPSFNFTGSGNTSNATFTAQNSTPIPGRSYKKAVRRMRK